MGGWLDANGLVSILNHSSRQSANWRLPIAANSLNNIGNVHRLRGDYDQALAYFERSLAIFTAIGDRSGEAMALSNIGIVHWSTGDYPAALEH